MLHVEMTRSVVRDNWLPVVDGSVWGAQAASLLQFQRGALDMYMLLSANVPPKPASLSNML
jgi:hypothetical protein